MPTVFVERTDSEQRRFPPVCAVTGIESADDVHDYDVTLFPFRERTRGHIASNLFGVLAPPSRIIVPLHASVVARAHVSRFTPWLATAAAIPLAIASLFAFPRGPIAIGAFLAIFIGLPTIAFLRWSARIRGYAILIVGVSERGIVIDVPSAEAAKRWTAAVAPASTNDASASTRTWKERLRGLLNEHVAQLTTNDLLGASATVSKAFELVEKEGDTKSLDFASVLLAASDMSRIAEAHEEAAALANTALTIGTAHRDDNVRGAALMRLGMADVERGYNDRAVERLTEALALLPANTPHAEAVQARIDELLREAGKTRAERH